MKKIFSALLIITLLLVSCQNSELPQETNDTDISTDELETATYEFSKQNSGFGFTFKGIDGEFKRGEVFFINIELANLKDENYVWFGSYSSFRAYVKLICTSTEEEYIIHPTYVRLTDDMPQWLEMPPGGYRTSSSGFSIGEDAPAGKYSMVCDFRGSEVVFEDIFTLD